MRQRNVPRRRDHHGFTLVEVMVAALVLMVGVLGVFVMIDGANRVTRDNNARTIGTGVAREILEGARSGEYSDVTDALIVQRLRERSHLAGEIRSGKWIINRRGLEYTVTADTCIYDDPADGFAQPPNPADPAAPAPIQDPCPAGAAGAGAATTWDSNPDDFRRVMLTMSWRRGNRTRQINQTTQIVNPGGGLGPRILKFPDANGGIQIGDHAGASNGPTAVTLQATSTRAHLLRWSANDGRSTGDLVAAGGGTSWSWDWKIGTAGSGVPGTDWVMDGTYAINAQPFDSRGVPGELRVATVYLNRMVPLAPKVIGGGRSQAAGTGSGTRVEIDWLPNAERDVIGYRVYRVDGTAEQRVCPPVSAGASAFTTDYNCIDTSVPDESVVPTVDYLVRAVDRPVLGASPSGTADGAPTKVTVGPIGLKLQPPGSLQVVPDSRPRLTWTAPSNGPVLFYRVYRDGKRYARTVSNATTWVDQTPAASTHKYSVSAVHDPSFREGQLSGEVSWP